MIVLDTSYHITFDARHSNPDLACTGKCKKVWWKIDLIGKDQVCPQCNSVGLCEAIPQVHFTVIDVATRPLKLTDFTSISVIPHKDKLAIKGIFDKNGVIEKLSVVKPAFEGLALREWC